MALQHAGELARGWSSASPARCSSASCSRRLRIISLMLSFSARHFAWRFHRDRSRQIALRHGRRHFGDRAHLGGQVRGELIHVIGKIPPRPAAHRARSPGRRVFLRYPLRGPPSSPDRRTSRACRSCVDRVGKLGDFAFGFDVSLRFKLPFATAVTTLRYRAPDSVRFDAMKFTLSVRSFHVPATPFTSAWPPSFPSVPTSRATRVTSDANELS